MIQYRYKLTDQDMKTFNGCQWTLNEWKETSGKGDLCGQGWLHCYSDPVLAVIMNRIHAKIDNPLLFKCEVEGKTLNDNGLKEGWGRMRLVEELDVPDVTVVQRTAFGILAAKIVCDDKKWNNWADKWLPGQDRSAESAKAACDACAAYAAVDAAVCAAWAAVDAAYSAAWADVDAAYSAAWADACAAWAADAAVRVADAVDKIDLIGLAHEAMKYQ